MRARTEAEVKAYADGYKACYKEFCRCLKKHTAEQAIKKMGVFVVVVNNCVEVAEQTEPNSSEKPNNCEDAENPSGDVWECGCFLDTYCKHQIYDRNPDGTINIVECGYEPKDEPQTDCAWK